MKTIPLTHNKEALVDDDDYPGLASYKWIAVQRRADSRHQIWVAIRSTGSQHIFMHREILGLTLHDKKEVLHVNGDRLDNRKHNLIIPGHSLVCRGRKFGRGQSKFKGVFCTHVASGWKACIVLSGKIKQLGTFEAETDAALAYDRAARKAFGQLTSLNFPNVEKYALLAKPKTKPKTSKYRGVCWDKKSGKWQAATKNKKKFVYLGSFTSEQKAAEAYDNGVRMLRGPDAITNFPLRHN